MKEEKQEKTQFISTRFIFQMDSCPLLEAEVGLLHSDSGLADRPPGQPAAPGELLSLPLTGAQDAKSVWLFI